MVTRKWLVQALSLALLLALPASAGAAKVLRVGSYHRIRGQFRSIQAAVDAATPGDWILIGPGDYKTTSSRAPAGHSDVPAAILVTTPGVHLRGMSRNAVVVDGTTRGPQCSTHKADQNFGPAGDSGNPPLGLNGIEVFKADNVSIENLTTCNFLGGSGDAGNGVWWNGGDGSGTVGGWGFYGGYLTATSSFYDPSDSSTAAQYGIFSSNWSGGTWDHAYTSNFNDSGFYIGACQQVCDQTMNHAWAEYNALGYSGSNSGGQLVVENSEFDNNQDGFDTNSQNGDNPPPQNGACPDGGISPVTHTHSCWVFVHNYVHDNNNPNVPTAGLAGGGPLGTGLSLSGARNDTVMGNRFVRNDAWGTIFVPFPDSGPPCTGGTDTGGQACIYDEFGDALIGNTYTDNGGYGNPTNGDFALTNVEPGPTDCFAGNTDTSGPLTATPSNAEQTYPSCDGHTVPPSASNPQSALFTEEVACDSTLSVSGTAKAPCAPTDHYPRRTAVVMHALPAGLATMADPCAGVPSNPWCSRGQGGGPGHSGGGGRPRCPRSTGRLHGATLGLLRLGMTRVAVRRAFRRSSNRRRRYMDFFCLRPNGIRVGYASPKLLRTVAVRERRRVNGRAILALTANPLYALRGVRPEAQLAAVARRLRTGPAYHVGLNYWYLAPNGPSTGVLKVRHGRIEEIGIADKRLTHGRRAALTFLRDFY